MSVTADVTKTGRTLNESIKVTVPSAATVATEARKPFYAGLGVVNLAVEQAREQAKARQGELAKLQEQVAKLPATVQAQVKALPTTVKTTVETLQDKGTALYGELVVRGEKLVTTIRKQPSTQAAEASVEQTVSSAKGTVASAKGTVTDAKKAAKAGAKAADDATEKVG